MKQIDKKELKRISDILKERELEAFLIVPRSHCLKLTAKYLD